jgi:hypothetical protein
MVADGCRALKTRHASPPRAAPRPKISDRALGMLSEQNQQDVRGIPRILHVRHLDKPSVSGYNDDKMGWSRRTEPKEAGDNKHLARKDSCNGE